MLRYIVALLLVTCLAGCKETAPPVQTPEPVLTVTVMEGYGVDIDPPAQLNIVMNHEGDPEQRCYDMGGTPTFDQALLYWLCEDADY
jgi:hypothetical protein